MHLAIHRDHGCTAQAQVVLKRNLSVFHLARVGLTAGETILGTWMDGGMKPSSEYSRHLPKNYALPPSGSMLIGEDGTLILPHVGAPELHPEEKYKKYPRPEFEPKNHYHEFVEAAMGNGVAEANFDFSGPSVNPRAGLGPSGVTATCGGTSHDHRSRIE